MSTGITKRQSNDSSHAYIQSRYTLSRFARRLPLLACLTVVGSGVFVPRAIAQTCASNVPHVQGTWRTLPYLMPINPISATLLNTGKILIVAGSENDADNNSTGAENYRNPSGTQQAGGIASHLRA